MSDDTATADAEAPDSTAPEPDAEVTDESAGDDEPIKNMGELRKVRQELKASREKYGPLAEALSGFDENDLNFIVKEWLPSFHTDQGKFVSYTQQILEQMTPAEKAEVKAEVAEEEAEADGKLTPEEVEEIVSRKLAEREATSAQEASVNQVYKDLAALGYEDPDSVEAQQVMFIALKQTDGDLDKAHEKLQEARQAAIDEYVASKGQGPTLPPKGVAANPAREGPKNIRDAGKQVHEFLANRAS